MNLFFEIRLSLLLCIEHMLTADYRTSLGLGVHVPL